MKLVILIIHIVIGVSGANVILPYDPLPYAFMPSYPSAWPYSPSVNPYWFQQPDDYYSNEPSELNSNNNNAFFKSGSNDQDDEGAVNAVDNRQLSIQFHPHLLPLQLNPNSPMLEESNACISTSGENGVCAPLLACIVVGRQAESNTTCRTSSNICCIRTRQSCGRTIYRNNTYWNSPNSMSSASTCQLTVRMNPRMLIQQRGLPICQVRLDFHSFSIAQPNAQSVCATDKFTVVGSSNNVPTICGDASGQHMYLTVPSPNSQLSLLFTFGQGGGGKGLFNRPSSTINRSWRIKVGLIPCGTNYLAPSDCLQYFTGTSGTISSFNWLDTTSTSTRQLANQDYNICFRSEMMGSSVSSSLCVTPCPQVSKSASSAFSISGLSPVSNENLGACNNDYLVIVGGYDPTQPHGPNNSQDRYCGSQLNVENNAATSSTVCTTVKNYKILYRTNGDETLTATADATEIGNIGFCLSFSHN